MHCVAYGGAEVLHGCEADAVGFAGGGFVLEAFVEDGRVCLGGCGRVWCGGGEHGGDFADFGVGADEVVFIWLFGRGWCFGYGVCAFRVAVCGLHCCYTWEEGLG